MRIWRQQRTDVSGVKKVESMKGPCTGDIQEILVIFAVKMILICITDQDSIKLQAFGHIHGMMNTPFKWISMLFFMS
jgi:hypothetical protein